MTYEEYAKYRDKMNMKDAEVAKRAQIPPSTFSDWKSGRCSPKLDKMSRIAEALGYDKAVFLSDVFCVRVEYNVPESGTIIEISEKEIIADLYEKADEQSKELVRRVLKYAEGIKQ